MPPLPAMVTVPELPPKQSTLVCALILPETTVAGSVMVTSTVVVHPFASFTVMVYVPAANPPKVPLATNVIPSIEYV